MSRCFRKFGHVFCFNIFTTGSKLLVLISTNCNRTPLWSNRLLTSSFLKIHCNLLLQTIDYCTVHCTVKVSQCLHCWIYMVQCAADNMVLSEALSTQLISHETSSRQLLANGSNRWSPYKMSCTRSEQRHSHTRIFSLLSQQSTLQE